MSRGRGRRSGPPIWAIILILIILSGSSAFDFLLQAIGIGILAITAFFIVRAILKARKEKEENTNKDPSRSAYQNQAQNPWESPAERSAQNARTTEAARQASQTNRRSASGETAYAGARSQTVPTPPPPPKPKVTYPPEVQEVVDEGSRAHAELTRLYAVIPDLGVKHKVQEILDVSDKIVADAVADPSDVPQIKKFLDYYLPTTIKLLNSYERMEAQGIEGKNISKTKDSINEMLDTAIEAYKRLLDSLFANQAMDVETDIQVMNTLLKREGLTGQTGFPGFGESVESAGGSAVPKPGVGGSAVQAQPK